MKEGTVSSTTRGTTIPLVVQVGFAGSRRLFNRVEHPRVDAAVFDAEIFDALRDELVKLPSKLRLGHGYFLCGISQVAVGADTLFARACSDLRIPHRVFLPRTRDAYLNDADNAGHPDFTAREKVTARALLDDPNTIQERIVSDAAGRPDRFDDTNIEIVRVSDVIVCLFRKDAGAGRGGTRHLMSRALARGRPLLEMQVDTDNTGKPVITRRWHNVENYEPPAVPEELQGIALAMEEAVGQGKAFEGLRREAGAVARRKQRLFQSSALLILGSHVLATAIAVLALAFLPAGLGWFFVAEAMLLSAGIVVHAYLYCSRTARTWSMSRLVAQLADSLKAMDQVSAYPLYLFALPIPDALRALRRTLCVLHLKATHRLDSKAWVSRRNIYLEDRLAGQLDYYEKHCRAAHRWLRRAHAVFYAAAAVAILATLGKAALEFHLFAVPVGHGHIVFPWLGLAAILLPVLAVAAISLAASFDLEAKAHTFHELATYLTRRRQLLKDASTEREFHALALEIEAHLLGETTTWYARRAFTGVT